MGRIGRGLDFPPPPHNFLASRVVKDVPRCFRHAFFLVHSFLHRAHLFLLLLLVEVEGVSGVTFVHLTKCPYWFFFLQSPAPVRTDQSTRAGVGLAGPFASLFVVMCFVMHCCLLT